ncbi:hypothetical protein ZWY2020_039094 [Hordeum vulgare]|nr:hypothetical protein ZWY2020_039094 [Hordeum vulgare]
MERLSAKESLLLAVSLPLSRSPCSQNEWPWPARGRRSPLLLRPLILLRRRPILLRPLPLPPRRPSSSSYAYRAEATAAAAGEEAPPTPTTAPPPLPPPTPIAQRSPPLAAQRPLAARKRWVRGLLKFGFLATLVGAVGGTGYATHAYSLAEVDHNTQEFRKEMTTPIPVPADATQLEVDLSTMLEEAVLYVKFLKLQIKIAAAIPTFL